jgi:hypothetical protein
MESFSQGRHSMDIEDKQNLTSLQALSPSAARLFKGLQDPSMARDTFSQQGARV